MDYKKVYIGDEKEILAQVSIPLQDWRENIHNAEAHESIRLFISEGKLTDPQKKIIEAVRRIMCNVPCKDIEKELDKLNYIIDIK